MATKVPKTVGPNKAANKRLILTALQRGRGAYQEAGDNIHNINEG